MVPFTTGNILKRIDLEKVCICLFSGGFAECFIAERISDKKIYALKIISKKLLEKPKARQKVYPILFRCFLKLSYITEQSIKIFAILKELLKIKKMYTCS